MCRLQAATDGFGYFRFRGQDVSHTLRAQVVPWQTGCCRKVGWNDLSASSNATVRGGEGGLRCLVNMTLTPLWCCDRWHGQAPKK